MSDSIIFGSGSRERNKVLIIDDTEMNRVLLKMIFEDEYQVVEAENGAEGLKKLREDEDSICKVLLDVVMPVMDGMKFLEQFMTNPVSEQIPVFLITAEADSNVIRRAYDMGVMDVISKPIMPYIVKWRVDSVVELYRGRARLDDKVQKQQEELLRQADEIIELNKGMIEALSTAIEFRSGESGEHVKRIHDITGFLLRETKLGDGLSEEEIIQIAMASIMHDIGKIAIPDAILNKPGRLTPEEFEIMKQHTVYGCQMLEKIPQLRKSAAYQYAYDIARHHHERWDGKGYPDGLKGDEISVWAQIVSLADVYDALVSKRVYKDAYGFDEAVQMIRDGKCGIFNPLLLDLFCEKEKEIRKIYQA